MGAPCACAAALCVLLAAGGCGSGPGADLDADVPGDGDIDGTALPVDGSADTARPDAPGRDALPVDAAVPDAALPPLRDDGLDPPWAWHEAAARILDDTTLPDAFTAGGYSLPPGSSVYAARIVDGVDQPAYVLYEAGGGAFSRDYWPASTIKVMAALAALERARSLGFTGAANVRWDSGFGDVLSAIYDRAIRDSSNIDYVRTFRVAGFEGLNDTFLTEERGFPRTVLMRSYVSGVSVRDVPGMTFTEAGRTAYVPASSSTADYGCPRDGNCTDLFELTEAVRRVVLDAEVTDTERFDVDPVDVDGIIDALCGAVPSFFADGVTSALGPGARVCHKPGWVPGLDYLDHGLVEDTSGRRFLLAAQVPDTGGSESELSLIAAHVLTALRDREDGASLQRDAGVPITVQLDDHGTTGEMRRAMTITVDAPGADRVEVHVDGWSIGTGSGAGPRFTVEYDFSSGGERLMTVRASSTGVAVGYRALRVSIPAP